MPYTPHPHFAEPPRDAKLWRYTNFTKFVDMLERGSLYFSRADLLGDRFEGSLARPNISERAVVYSDLITKVGEDKWQSFQEQFHRMVEAARRNTFVNSWHVGAYESAAMWGLYTAADQGIAIQSTFDKLSTSLKTERLVMIGTVSYMDYETEWLPEGNTLFPFVHKRRSYGFEQELRAVIQEFRTGNQGLDLSRSGPAGLLVEVDVGKLIDSVYVSPTAPEWFNDLVRAVVKRYRLQSEVKQSSLAGDPIL